MVVSNSLKTQQKIKNIIEKGLNDSKQEYTEERVAISLRINKSVMEEIEQLLKHSKQKKTKQSFLEEAVVRFVDKKIGSLKKNHS